MRETPKILLLSTLWLCLVVWGSVSLMAYGNRAGESAKVSATWPAESCVPPERGKATVLLFLHPRCPCSRATVRELEEALAPSSVPFCVRVVVFAPTGEPEQWPRTGLVRDAGELPGAEIFFDQDGKETERFGVRTSGHVLVYSSDGQLAFSGGVTPSRGHEGENAGMDAVRRFVRGQPLATRETVVFGCQILDADAACFQSQAACPEEGEPCH